MNSTRHKNEINTAKQTYREIKKKKKFGNTRDERIENKQKYKIKCICSGFRGNVNALYDKSCCVTQQRQ